jgi:hypothetical protein
MLVEHALGAVDTHVVRRHNTVIAVATPALAGIELCA